MSAYDDYLVGPEWLAGHLTDPNLRVCDCRFTGDPAPPVRPTWTSYPRSRLLLLAGAAVRRRHPGHDLPAPSGKGRHGARPPRDHSRYPRHRLRRQRKPLRHKALACTPPLRTLDGATAGRRPGSLARRRFTSLEAGQVTAQPVTFRPDTSQQTVTAMETVATSCTTRRCRCLTCDRPADPDRRHGSRGTRRSHPHSDPAPWDNIIDHAGSYLDARRLRDRFRQAGLDPAREIITYCQGGIRAAHTAAPCASPIQPRPHLRRLLGRVGRRPGPSHRRPAPDAITGLHPK